jgi:hypothetical protein
MSGTFTVNQTMFWRAIAEWIISTGTIKDKIHDIPCQQQNHCYVEPTELQDELTSRLE